MGSLKKLRNTPHDPLGTMKATDCEVHWPSDRHGVRTEDGEEEVPQSRSSRSMGRLKVAQSAGRCALEILNRKLDIQIGVDEGSRSWCKRTPR